MEEFLMDLGRRHFSYGSAHSLIELLGRIFLESILPIFARTPNNEAIHKSYTAFFRVIVFWMQTGFKYVQTQGRIKIRKT